MASESKFKVGDRVVQDKLQDCCDLVDHWNTYWRRESGPLTDDTFVVTQISDGMRRYVRYSSRVGANGPQIEEHFLKLAPLKIEAGKFYKTRDGRKVGPMTWVDGRWYVRGAVGTWNTDGTASSHHKPTATEIGDLIAEWVDEPAEQPAAAVAASNDNVAPAKFKVGDRVRGKNCIGDDVDGVVYSIDAADDDLPYMLDGGGWCRERDLELVTTPTAIVALIEDGHPKPATKPKIHPSAVEATTEAERLALEHPGQLFGVFVLADSKIADIVTTQTAVLRAA